MIVLAALIVASCGGKKEVKKNQFGAFAGKLNLPEKISSPKFSFAESELMELQKVVVLRDENGRGLFVFDLESGKLKQISERMVKSFKTFDRAGAIFYTKKEIANPPKYELRKFTLKDEVTSKILISNKRIEHLQKMGERAILYWSNDTAYVYDLMTSRLIKAEKLKSKLFYYGIKKNDFVIYNFGKVEKFKFPKGRIIWADINTEKRLAVVYAAPQGAYLIKDGKKIFIGKLENPEIFADGLFVVGMKESYDNQKLLHSDIYVYEVSTGKLKNITNSSNEIELYPSPGSNGTFVSYSTPNGQIKFLNFTEVFNRTNKLKGMKTK